MSIDCPGQRFVPTLCTPECTRWTQINQSQPILYFHDTSNWDPNYYPAASSNDPQDYLQPAVDLWNSAYSCGTLFQRTLDRTQAELIVDYAVGPGDQGQAGEATCACDEDDDVCVNQFDHSSIFSTVQPAFITMYCEPVIQGLSQNQWINVYLHELGHILGMGHVYGLPVDSIMGNGLNSNNDVVLYPFDREELARRYPCDCTLTSSFRAFVDKQALVTPTSSYCPVCQGDTIT